jgi:hypothetical protein
MKQSWNQTLITAQGDGTALTAAAAASCLPTAAKLTLPNNFFHNVGDVIKLRASGRISCAVTTPGTARFDLRLGGVVVFDTLAMNLNIIAKTNVHWILDVDLVVRSVGNGTTATLLGQGTWTSEAVIASPLPTVGGSGLFTVPYNTAPTAGTGFDSTSALAMDFFFTQTVATGSMTLHQFALHSLL